MTLSDKIKPVIRWVSPDEDINDILRIEDVKEAIKELKSRLMYRECGKCNHESYGKFIHEEDIEEIFGKELC